LAPTARAIEVALADIAHDIRTPLTGIVALAELLASSDLAQREREWANAIKSGANHLAALTTLIVDAARAAAAGLILRNEPFSPRALAEAVGQALVARAGNKNAKAAVAIARDLPAMVSGDGLRLRAALENLADNAVKFTHQGAVNFSVGAEPAARGRVRLIFTVADTGIGISASELKLLFRPFAQASEQIAKRYGGAGLGLLFVRRIAKAMGGDLKVASKKSGGSTFRLSALVERVNARPAAERSGARGAGAAAGDPMRRGKSLWPRGDEYDPVRARPPCRFCRDRRGGGESRRARRLRRGVDGHHTVGSRRHRGDGPHSRAAGQGRQAAGDRNFRPHRERRRKRRARGRHEFLFQQVGQLGQAGAGAGDCSRLISIRLQPVLIGAANERYRPRLLRRRLAGEPKRERRATQDAN
jgi:hypothetical protein